MSSDYDIEMNLNDTLELDTIIEKSSLATNPVTIESGGDNTLEGLQKHIAVFNPNETGEYKIDVNGQNLKINVISSNVIVDDFEDGDISEYSGSTGNAIITNTPVIHGSYAVKINSGNNDNGIYAQPSDLDNVPKRGGSYEISWQKQGGIQDAEPIVFYAHQGGSGGKKTDGYAIQAKSGYFRLRTWKDGSFNTIGSTTYDNSNDSGTWRKFYFEWNTDDTHYAELRDSNGNKLASVSGSDSTYTSGGINLNSNNNDGSSDIVFDNFVGMSVTND